MPDQGQTDTGGDQISVQIWTDTGGDQIPKQEVGIPNITLNCKVGL